MDAFFVSIIFLGVLLVSGALFFIVMDRVNGKDFFKEFDRKKDEMFNLIQDSEEMVQELNRMSDYVVTTISEKNQEFFNKTNNLNFNETVINKEVDPIQVPNGLNNLVQEAISAPKSNNSTQSETYGDIVQQNKEPDTQRMVNTQFSHTSERYQKDSSSTGNSRLTLNSKRREILLLIEQGLSNDEISDKLKIGKGEIGLIRGLSK